MRDDPRSDRQAPAEEGARATVLEASGAPTPGPRDAGAGGGPASAGAGTASEVAAQDPERWFAALCKEQYRLVYAVCYKVLRSAQDAEDAAQEAFMKAYRNRHTLRDPAVATGWLARIARNAALDLGRRRGRRQRLQNEVQERADVSGAGGVVAAADADHVYDDERERLLARVAALPEAEGLVVTLRFLDGMKPAEIAARLGEKPSTVRVRLHRALKRLRESLGGERDAA